MRRSCRNTAKDYGIIKWFLAEIMHIFYSFIHFNKCESRQHSNGVYMWIKEVRKDRSTATLVFLISVSPMGDNHSTNKSPQQGPHTHTHTEHLHDDNVYMYIIYTYIHTYVHCKDGYRLKTSEAYAKCIFRLQNSV